jgi:hypothetical protein
LKISLFRKKGADTKKYGYPDQSLDQEKQESDDPNPFDPNQEFAHYRAITW